MIPDAWYQRKSRELQRLLAASEAGMGAAQVAPLMSMQASIPAVSQPAQVTATEAHMEVQPIAPQSSNYTASEARMEVPAFSQPQASSYATEVSMQAPSFSPSRPSFLSPSVSPISPMKRGPARGTSRSVVGSRSADAAEARRRARGIGRRARRGSLFGADAATAPPPPGRINPAIVVGWAALLLVGTGIFYATTRQGRAPKKNSRRRSSRGRAAR